jgi:DNA-binding NtrC family response regulator
LLLLRERREDIPAFADFFLEKYCKELCKPTLRFDKECMDALIGYDYPGNIRELENIVERAVVLADDDVLHISDIPDEIQYRKKVYLTSRLQRLKKLNLFLRWKRT